MTFSIGMRTMFRRADYCSQTVARLSETGSLHHRDVVGFHVSHGEGITPNMNGVHALRMAAKDGADWVLFLEDDIDIVDDFVGSVSRWLQDHATPDVLAYPLGSFYKNVTDCPAVIQAGEWRIPRRLYYGSQAVVFRTPDAADYADWLEAYTRVQDDKDRSGSFDLRISDWHGERRPKTETLCTPIPCLVDHIGEESLMGTWTRTGRILHFAGRGWSYRGRES